MGIVFFVGSRKVTLLCYKGEGTEKGPIWPTRTPKLPKHDGYRRNSASCVDWHYVRASIAVISVLIHQSVWIDQTPS